MRKSDNAFWKYGFNFIWLVIFAISSFYLISNILHYRAVRKEVYIGNKDMARTNFLTNFDKVKAETNSFKFENYKGDYSKSEISKLYNSLNRCVNSINSKELTNFNKDNYIDYSDLYKVVKTFENDVINSCIVKNLSFIMSYDNGYFAEISPYLNLEFSAISREISFVKSELLGNSEYYFSLGDKDLYGSNINNMYGIIMNNYNDIVSVLLHLSHYMNGGML